MGNAIRQFVAIIAVLALACLLAGCTRTAATVGGVEEVTVVRVVDGDTLVVKTVAGQEKVRLIGVDCPESVSSDESRNCEEGRIASDYAKGLLPEGARVYLTRERSDADDYGRLLRHVWLSDPSGRESDEGFARESMVEAVLVSAGMAQAKRYDPDTAYYPFLKTLGDEAIASGAGVSYKWATR